MPPGRNMDDMYTILRSGMWRLSYKLSKEGKTRFFTEFLPLLHDVKTLVLGERDNDSWYLVYLGTKKASRGQGLAKKLVEKITRLVSISFSTSLGFVVGGFLVLTIRYRQTLRTRRAISNQATPRTPPSICAGASN